ncbi:MAG TPA: helix-turn-helix transcriptional regulator [Pseudonocardiaceae bacterium]|nr:helix-turn-helix transcriptional regulator [Pseudonocardiaceae bacterium]
MESPETGRRYCRCGTYLARDNTEGQCARCARTGRDRLVCAPDVPEEFWRSEQLRAAFAAQHLGRVSRAYRIHPHHHAVYGASGITQTLLAQWVNMTQPQISKIENGPPVRNLIC